MASCDETPIKSIKVPAFTLDQKIILINQCFTIYYWLQERVVLLLDFKHDAQDCQGVVGVAGIGQSFVKVGPVLGVEMHRVKLHRISLLQQEETFS